MQLAEWALGGRSWSAPSIYISPRMGGGPRTYPGGVSKWQWKKMQEKKSKQILKARLLRERQLYEMRKRAELKAADLEKPWEITRTTQAPTLFAVTADDQLQAMADRFVRRGAIDLWTDKDGPLSHSAAFVTRDGKPSARVFPRDALYSTQPYSLASPLPPDNHNGRSSNPSPSRYLPPHNHDGHSSNLSPSRYPPPQNHNGRSSNLSSSRYPPQNHNGRSSNLSSSRYPPQNHNGRSSNLSSSRYPPPQNHNGRSSNPSPSRYPPHPPPHNRNSTPMIGKSIITRSISVLSSVSGQGNFSDAHITKENHKQKSVKDTERQRHRFLASPAPPRADGQGYSNKTKSSAPKSAMHTFAGFNLEKRSTQRLREASYESKTDMD
ncbi:hypothetical protein SUGI_1151010 [Cryptomeria japonica]|uniref:uncharacterized protein LOC131072049 n=1 Tax=Cryptomeria japonica TaxID=3369 RepID=UPI002414A155|nr:uncharacterized protein LOC131072049 [Cryptomeria japonica]GLJ53884.1 hypothetical protein SUGI_1151010 [Cryptomeria japonica]